LAGMHTFLSSYNPKYNIVFRDSSKWEDAQNRVRSLYRTVIAEQRKRIRNSGMLMGTRSGMEWRNQVHSKLVIEADALNQRRRRISVWWEICFIYRGKCRQFLCRSKHFPYL